MKNDKKVPRIFLMLFCIFLLSLIFTVFDMPFSDVNSTPYNLGYAIGVAARNMLKILAALAIVKMVYVKMKAVRG
ncbi:hypothetical protein [Labilibaculum manganireducens]|uniref:hypothetical protein n=1 Tax=Labilibaculum manganireducens TaxID=1940525 RepID=UPI0029F553DA|nr:hypothetical protein [Labilibaculum manganireducens]